MRELNRLMQLLGYKRPVLDAVLGRSSLAILVSSCGLTWPDAAIRSCVNVPRVSTLFVITRLGIAHMQYRGRWSQGAQTCSGRS